MASAVWLAVLLLAFSSCRVDAELYPDMLNTVTQLTFSGDHSFPRFSSDGRYIYFSAKGGPYGKNCDDIYKLDLKYYSVNEDNWRISRVSTGLGHATRVSLSADGKDSLMYESSFETVFNTPRNETIGSYCPASACTATDTTSPCKTSSTIEHFFDTNIYSTNIHGAPTKRLTIRDPSLFRTSVDQMGNWVIRIENCTLDSAVPSSGTIPEKVSSTCLRLSDKEGKNEKTITTPAGYVDYAAFASVDANNIKLFYSFRPLTKAEATKDSVFSAEKTVIRYVTIAVATGDFSADTLFSDSTPGGGGDGDAEAARLFVRPHTFASKAIFTRIDTNGTTALYEVTGVGEKPNYITDPTYKSKMADRDGNNRLVFVRQLPGETEYQLFIAFRGEDKPSALIPTYDTIPGTDYAERLDFFQFAQYVELEGRIGRARLSELYGDVFFEWTGDKDSNCQQVYHIDTGPNDYANFRRLSTGIGRTAGMDFFISSSDGQLGKKVVYASNFMRKETSYTNLDVSGCELVGCEKGSQARTKNKELDQFCASATYNQYLGNEFDIYQTNMFGNIEKRLTNNTMFDGEPSISLNNRLVYSQVSDSRVDLVVRWLDYPKSKSKVITSIMPIGYYGGASFSPDAKWVVFHGSQAGKDVYTFKKFLDTYQVINTTISEIFIINVYNRTYRQLTSSGLHSQNPTFTPDANIIFEQTSSDNKHSLWQIDLHGNNLVQLTVEDDYKAWKLSFARNHPNATVFVGDFRNDTDTNPKWTNRIYFSEYKPKMPSTMSTTPTSTSSTNTSTPRTTSTGTPQTTSSSTESTTLKITTTVADSSGVTVQITKGDDGGAGQTAVGSLPALLIGYWLLRNGF